MKKIGLIIFFCFIFIMPIKATDTFDEINSSISDELYNFKNSLPDEIIKYLPSEVWEGDFSKLTDTSLSEASILDIIIDYLFLGLNSAIKCFSSILIVILISGIFNMLQSSLSSDLIKSSFSLASALCSCFTVFSVCTSLTAFVCEYLHALCGVMEAFAPIMATMYVMSGNISTGALSGGSILLFIAIIERFLLTFMLPIVEICICFSVIKAFGGQLEFGGISKTLKNTFTGVTIFTMSVFMFVMSSKNILTQSADSLSIKTAKFAISNFVPVVGSSVNDALRTVTASISYIKNACGVLGVIVVVLIVLPVIISLLLHRLVFSVLSGIAKAIGCANEATVIDEGGSICGFLTALVCCSGILFIFSLTIFIKASVVGG